MKIWITRNSAFSLQCGGLERCWVHFSKPSYVYEKLTEKERDLPFGDILESEGMFRKIGWKEFSGKTWVPSLSVGNWLGYDSPISYFIWDKIQEHFLNAPFDTWHEMERAGTVKLEDFCLEMEISISLVNEPVDDEESLKSISDEDRKSLIAWRTFNDKITLFEDEANLDLFQEIYGGLEGERLIHAFVYKCDRKFPKFETYLTKPQKNLTLIYITKKIMP